MAASAPGRQVRINSASSSGVTIVMSGAKYRRSVQSHQSDPVRMSDSGGTSVAGPRRTAALALEAGHGKADDSLDPSRATSREPVPTPPLVVSGTCSHAGWLRKPGVTVADREIPVLTGCGWHSDGMQPQSRCQVIGNAAPRLRSSGGGL